MAFRAGTTSAFYLANAAGALQDLSPYLDNISYPQTTAMLEVTGFGSNSKVFIPGLGDGDQVSISGAYDPTPVAQLGSLRRVQTVGGSAAAGFVWGPGGSVAGQIRIAGSVWVPTLNPAATVAGRVEYSATLQITGAVTNGTF